MNDAGRIDWFRVIVEIQRSGHSGASERMSLEAIGEACGRSLGWAWNLKNMPGAEPRYHEGMLLLALYAEHTDGAAAPLLTPIPSRT